MTQLISIYIKKLAVYMIFTVFVNILVPENSYKNHIYFVLGIIIIINIIAPISKISSNPDNYNFNIGKTHLENQLKFNNTTQQDIIINQFNTDFKKHILSDFTEASDVEISSEIIDNTLVINEIRLIGGNKDTAIKIAEKYDISSDSIKTTGDD